MLRSAQLAFAFSLTLTPLPQQALGQTPSPLVPPENPLSSNVTQLGEITVSATRSPRQIDDVPSSVSVITAATIQKQGARNLKEMLRDEPDVTVPVGPTRFGTGGSPTGRAGPDTAWVPASFCSLKPPAPRSFPCTRASRGASV